MTKKASITIVLVPEAESEANETIKSQIMNDTFVGGIPFCAQIAVVEVGEPHDGLTEMLQKEGYSKNVAENVTFLYMKETESL
jgi:hypothetical protein